MAAKNVVLEILDFGFSPEQIAEEIKCSLSTVHSWKYGYRGQKNGIGGKYLMPLLALRDRLLAQQDAVKIAATNGKSKRARAA